MESKMESRVEGKKMAPAAGFEPATKWLTEAVFEPGNTLFSLKDRSF